MSLRYPYSTLWLLQGRSLCPRCASNQRRLVSSMNINIVTSQFGESNNTAPSHTGQSQEVEGESPRVRIRFHRTWSILTRPLRIRKGTKKHKHGSHVIERSVQLAATEGTIDSRAANTQLHQRVSASQAEQFSRFSHQPSRSGLFTRTGNHYALDLRGKSMCTQDGSRKRTMGGGDLDSTLGLWDRQRRSVQSKPLSESNRRAFSVLAACGPIEWANTRVLQRSTAHCRRLFGISRTPHKTKSRLGQIGLHGYGTRLLNSQTSYRAPAGALQTAQSQNVKSSDYNSADMRRESHIIERLRLWQEQHQFDPVEMFAELPDSGKPGEVQNLLTRSSVGDHLIDANATFSDDDLNSMKTFYDGQLMDSGSHRPFLQRGDLIELVGGNGNQQPTLAIFIREFETQSQFYTMQGRWVHRLPRTIQFSVPGFLDRTSVDELLPYLPLKEVSEELADRLHSFDSSVPREVGSSIIRKMLDFWNASDLAYRKHATQLDNVHDLMAHESEARFVALSEVATKVFGSLPKGHSRPYPILFAVHRALMQKDYGFTVDRRNHRITRVFEVRPKREIRLITKVRDWIRDYQETVVASANRSEASSPSSRPQRASPIVDFVNKARSLIIESRRTRTSPLSSGLGPSLVKLDPQTTEACSLFQAVHCVAFSEADKCIIRFLEAWACYRIFSLYSVMNSLGSMVLRAIGLYEDRQLDQGTCWLFLQEIGVLAPWENRTVFNTQLALPGHAISAELDDIHRKTIEPETRLSLRDLKDTMQDFRHDWGDLEVFCIDDEDAKEIDDGISVQRVAGSPSENWVHVHVANPSAFIDPDHFISSYAAHLTQTIYLPERTYTMLPKSWTQARLSLAPHRPVLTFSARINGEGGILENKVTSGIIRNVTYLTPSTVKQHLAEQLSSEVMTVITVGGQMPKSRKRDLQSNLSKAQIEKLQLLQSIGNKRSQVRTRRGANEFDTPSPDLSVYGGLYGMPIRLPSHGRSRFYEGDPVIQLRSKPWDPTVRFTEPTTSFVRNLMILAGEVAAQWCEERNLPVIYRCTVQNPDLPDPTAFLRDHLWPSQDQYGNSPFSIGFQYINLIGRAKASTAPLPHMALGVKSYTKVTSPLRRYSDLVVHWQIEAALRQEACTGASQFKIHDHSYFPFSKARLDSLIPGIESRERLVRAAESSSNEHWVAQLLLRALYFKEATLPEKFELFVWTKGNPAYGNVVAGMIKGLAIQVNMAPSALTETTGVDIGDWWEVKLGRVDVYSRKISVEPIRLIKKAEGSVGKVAALSLGRLRA